MKKIFLILLISVFLLGCTKTEYRTISAKDYVSKMKAGWIGQMAGVGWGAPTEFRWNGVIIQKDDVPQWQPEMTNQFYQDDIYVEMTFLRTLELYGLDVDIRQAGIDFANSQYQLWHANKAGRDNLRSGIAPPYSGYPQFNTHADDIDYQIEADYAGLISPGLFQSCVDLGEKFGRLMNYGDGLYGGQFVAGMYAEAFFNNDVEQVIRAGLDCIPQESQYYECIVDVIDWYHQNPNDWQKTWQLINAKYHLNPNYRKFSCSGSGADFNIDAKINGAYIVMGLLYGQGDMDKTIVISMRCGQDSDCNPSNAAGVLATMIGYENLDAKFTSALDPEPKFSYTDYNFPQLVTVCQELAKRSVLKYGGKVKTIDGEEVFYIPVKTPSTSRLEACWNAQAFTGDEKFTAEEMKQIKIKIRKPEEFIQTWQISGPYNKSGVPGLQLFNVEFAPEKNAGKWQNIQLGKDGLHQTLIDFIHFYDTEDAVAFAKTRFYSDADQAAKLELGSDDGAKVWLNDNLIFEINVARGCNPADDNIDLNLKSGWNELLIKVNQGTGGWELTACLTDTDGKALKNLKYEF